MNSMAPCVINTENLGSWVGLVYSILNYCNSLMLFNLFYAHFDDSFCKTPGGQSVIPPIICKVVFVNCNKNEIAIHHYQL